MWLLIIIHTRSSKLLVNYSIIDRHDQTFNEPFPVSVSWPFPIAWAFSRCIIQSNRQTDWRKGKKIEDESGSIIIFQSIMFHVVCLLLIWRLFANCTDHLHCSSFSWGSTTFDSVHFSIRGMTVNKLVICCDHIISILYYYVIPDDLVFYFSSSSVILK